MGTSRAPIWVALLRGVNVGGRNRIPMGDLRARLESLGFENVRTYIQSGNIVVASRARAAEIATRIAGAVADGFGVDTTAVVRSPGELRTALGASPLAAIGAQPAYLQILFLADMPDPAAAALLDPDRSPRDHFDLIGRDVHIHFGAGSARSRLTAAYFERTLGVPGTARNLNTVRELVAMTTD